MNFLDIEGLIIQSKDYHRALESCDRAIRLDPECVAAYFSRGTAYFFLGNQPKALANWRRAWELDAKLVMTHISELKHQMNSAETPIDLSDLIEVLEEAIAKFTNLYRTKPNIHMIFNCPTCGQKNIGSWSFGKLSCHIN